ncbi:DUF3014 domain-containing protein [Comamonas sp. NLF-1-9]|uniref:DUF3014 domain-containing protein n=1 Tax=Comamonas sp. NLF-1-9 TaxID=2853163 RepID=UPI001C4409D0|nr:DUF3014 domain-containing protein [Comamonas sp. NLF-1-9]QXL83286.1 DUF3014 domain-containing protein [Comamonas sp. NLF-1-9]
MPQPDPTELRPPRPRSRRDPGWLLLLVLLAAGIGWYAWNVRGNFSGAPAPGATNAQTAAVQQSAPTDAPPAAEPPEGEIRNPIEEPLGEQPVLPALDESDVDVGKELAQLLGGQRAGAFLQLDAFVRRAVATVDNLAREQAPARMWPVHPMPGRFTVQGEGAAPRIAAENSARYEAFVAFAESVPVAAAARLYARLYPLFQVAYEELGYPGKYFNDRLVAVIDHLLASPEPAEPPAVHLVSVAGQVQSLQPWVRYEFVDPQLQQLSAGQKIMVRVGLDKERRLKRVLLALRAQVARTPAPMSEQ